MNRCSASWLPATRYSETAGSGAAVSLSLLAFESGLDRGLRTGLLGLGIAGAGLLALCSGKKTEFLLFSS